MGQRPTTDQRTTGIQMQTDAELETDLGPYASLAEANAAIEPRKRFIGKEVKIITAGVPARYWWSGGIADINLIAISTGGGGGGSITSVNGQPGPAVVLTSTDTGSIPTTEKGTINGVGTLDSSGKQPMSEAAVLSAPSPVNTPITAGMTPQQTAEALQGEVNELTVVSNPLKQSIYNRGYMADFYSAVYDFINNVVAAPIGIGWYGDSVSGDIATQFILRMSRALPMNIASWPGQLGGGMNYVLTGPYKYKWDDPQATDQVTLNGVSTPVSLTRSGSVATIVFAGKHDFAVGQPITIAGYSQAEYNGTFLITGTTTPFYAFTFNVSGSPATPATGAGTAYGGQPDFTYLSSASHTELLDGAILTLDSALSSYSKIVSFFATGPGMGSVKIELLNYNTSAVLSTVNLDLSGVSVGAIKDLKTGLDNLVPYKIRYTATGRVIHLLTYFYENGILPIKLGLGGTSYSQNNFSNNTIFTYLCNELNTRLIFIQGKEESLEASLSNVCTKMNLLTKTTKFIVNSLPDSGGDAIIIAQGKLYKEAAIANKYCYFDGFAVFGSYAELFRLGWQGDGVHVSTMAKRYVNDIIMSDIESFEFQYGGYLIKNIDQRTMGVNAFAILNKLNIVTGNSNKNTEVIKSFGSGALDSVIIQNVGRLILGAETDPNSCSISPRTAASIKINKIDGTEATLYCAGIQAVGLNMSSIEHRLAVGGGVGNGVAASRAIQAHFFDTGGAHPAYSLRKSRYTSGTPAATFGIGSDTAMHNAAKSPIVCEQDDITWEVATASSESAKRTFWLMASGVLRKAIEFLSNGSINLLIPGAKIIYKTGTNQSVGSTTLVAGVVTVANTLVTANTLVKVQLKTPGGIMGVQYKYSVVANTSFTITAVDAAGATVTTDTSVVDYYLTELN